MRASDKHRLDPAAERNKVLDFVAIDGEERPLLPREERILEHREDQASEGERLRAQSPFVEIHDDPVALIHRLAERKRRLRLAHDVAEVRIGGEGRSLVEDRLPHRGLHRFALPVVAEFEVLPDLGVLSA